MQMVEHDREQWYFNDDEPEPVCVCEAYEGARHPVYCLACLAWTDDMEIAALEAALDAACPTKPMAHAVASRRMRNEVA